MKASLRRCHIYISTYDCMPTPSELCNAFSLFDKNGDGTITLDECKAVLMRGDGMTEEDAIAKFRTVDTDDSGSVGYLEFVCAWSNSNPREILADLLAKCAEANSAEDEPVKVLDATYKLLVSQSEAAPLQQLATDCRLIVHVALRRPAPLPAASFLKRDGAASL